MGGGEVGGAEQVVKVAGLAGPGEYEVAAAGGNAEHVGDRS